MEQSIGQQTLGGLQTGERSSPGLWRLRLAFGWTILSAALAVLFALSWDIQWHTAVGRDRTLTMPHLCILGSILVMGLGALAAVLTETVWARRSPLIARSGTRFAGLFSSSLGAYLVGYGALDSAIAFPLDQYWHTLYGVDVAIWAPFHLMLITGLCVSCLGVTEILVSGAHLAASQGAKISARAGYAGAIIALATLMGVFSILLPDSLGPAGFIVLGNLVWTVYPLLLGAFGMFVLSIAIRALPWRAMATSVAAVYLVFGVLNFLLIPQLMTWLLGIEQQSLRPRAPTISVLAVAWQYGLIIAAVLLDIALRIAQRRGWSLKRTNRTTLVASLIGMSLAALVFPDFLSNALAYSIYGPRGGQPHGVLPQPHASAVLIVAASLLLGWVGTWIGNWLGAGMGESIQRKELSER